MHGLHRTHQTHLRIIYERRRGEEAKRQRGEEAKRRGGGEASGPEAGPGIGTGGKRKGRLKVALRVTYHKVLNVGKSQIVNM